MGFNDKDFDAESYVKVNERLQEFWKDHPKGRLETEVGLNDGVLIVMARLYRDKEDRPFATGHSFLEGLSGEKVGEYTETVAVGRALALAGYKVEKSIASSEEMKRFSNRRASKKTSDKVEERKEEPKQDEVAEATTEALPALRTSRFKLPTREATK